MLIIVITQKREAMLSLVKFLRLNGNCDYSTEIFLKGFQGENSI